MAQLSTVTVYYRARPPIKRRVNAASKRVQSAMLA